MKNMLAKVADELGLTQQEKDATVPGKTINSLYYRLQWANTFLYKAGLIVRLRRGFMAITEEGKKVLASGIDEIDRKLLNRYELFRRFTRSSKSNKSSVTEGSHVMGL